MPARCHPQEVRGEEITERAGEQHSASRAGLCSICQVLLEQTDGWELIGESILIGGGSKRLLGDVRRGQKCVWELDIQQLDGVLRIQNIPLVTKDHVLYDPHIIWNVQKRQIYRNRKEIIECLELRGNGCRRWGLIANEYNGMVKAVLRLWWWFHNSKYTKKKFEFHTLNGWTLWNANYILIKLFKNGGKVGSKKTIPSVILLSYRRNTLVLSS